MKNWLICGHLNPSNLGDQMTQLAKYFQNLSQFDLVDIEFLPGMDLKEYDGVIFGAGGMLYGESEARIRSVVDHGIPVVLFGVGLNYDGDEVRYPDWLSKCALVGLRDFGNPFHWCPCPSAFNFTFNMRHHLEYGRIVTYGHAVTPSTFHLSAKKSPDEFGAVISHLASGSVVTDSYHGAYWGRLVGSEVAIDPRVKSIKFKTLPTTLNLLGVRAAINAFYGKVEAIL